MTPIIPYNECTEGRKNGQASAHVENLDKQTSSATNDQSTNTQGVIQEDAETCVILSCKDVNHNDKAVKELVPQIPEDMAAKSKSNHSQKKIRQLRKQGGATTQAAPQVSSMNQSLAHKAFTDSDPHSTQVKIPPDIRMNESASTPHVEEVSQAAHLPSSTETNT